MWHFVLGIGYDFSFFLFGLKIQDVNKGLKDAIAVFKVDTKV